MKFRLIIRITTFKCIIVLSFYERLTTLMCLLLVLIGTFLSASYIGKQKSHKNIYKKSSQRFLPVILYSFLSVILYFCVCHFVFFVCHFVFFVSVILYLFVVFWLLFCKYFEILVRLLQGQCV